MDASSTKRCQASNTAKYKESSRSFLAHSIVDRVMLTDREDGGSHQKSIFYWAPRECDQMLLVGAEIASPHDQNQARKE